jgi:hypothetical protein
MLKCSIRTYINKKTVLEVKISNDRKNGNKFQIILKRPGTQKHSASIEVAGETEINYGIDRKPGACTKKSFNGRNLRIFVIS